MKELTHYRFKSVWTVDGPPDDAFTVLQRLTEYPLWWPEIKDAIQLTDNEVEIRCRSLLPYDLSFLAVRSREDRHAGVLEAKMVGDLEGVSRWTIDGSDSFTRLVFDEEVDTNKELLNRFAPIARPAYVANHSLMMRHGESGLRTYLAGLRLARTLQDRDDASL